MNDLVPFIFILLIFFGSIASSKKKQARKAANHPYQPAPPQPAKSQPARAPQQAGSPAQPAMDTVEHREIAPTVHAHVEPDCDIHDAPGSLGVTSGEGQDPCHAEQMTHVRAPAAAVSPAPEGGGLQFDWSGDSMVKAVVMQEVLTRPCQRRRR